METQLPPSKAPQKYNYRAIKGLAYIDFFLKLLLLLL